MSRAKMLVRAPAKLNLYLRVLGRRADGYHDIQTIMQPIALYDELAFEPLGEGRLRLDCEPLELGGPENLVWRAARLLQKRFAPARGVRINLRKRIPVAAGLGGGSSDAAATLLALNELWELGLPERGLQELGLELGADVPFFVRKGAALAEGVGEVLHPWPALDCWVVLVKPHFCVCTAWAYRNLPKQGLTRQQNCINILALDWTKKSLAQVGGALFNEFETLVIAKYPFIEQIKTRLLAQGAKGALMSGSGPAVFGLFAERRRAQVAFNSLKRFMQEKGVVFLVKAIGE